jgi:hypothetical protein
MSDEKNIQQDEEQQDDLEVTDEADDVKGGGYHVGVKKQPEGFRGAPKKGPDTFHGS